MRDVRELWAVFPLPSERREAKVWKSEICGGKAAIIRDAISTMRQRFDPMLESLTNQTRLSANVSQNRRPKLQGLWCTSKPTWLTAVTDRCITAFYFSLQSSTCSDSRPIWERESMMRHKSSETKREIHVVIPMRLWRVRIRFMVGRTISPLLICILNWWQEALLQSQ